jgi:hypothetical protein
LVLGWHAEEPALPPDLQRAIVAAFERGCGHGLLHLGAAQVASALPPGLAWWRDFAARYVTALCAASVDADLGAASRKIDLGQGQD